MQLSALLSSLALAGLVATAPLDKTTEIYRFPLGTWVENLTVRGCGSILLSTLQPTGTIYEINPFDKHPEPRVVYTLPESSGATGFSGLTETTPDNFYAAAGNVSLTTLTGVKGTARIYHLDLLHNSATIIANVTSASLLNGLTTLNNHTLLAADSNEGVVYSIDTRTGASRVVINIPETHASGFGVNGLRVRDNFLYFTSTFKSLYVRVPIHADGTVAGEAQTIATSGICFEYDDFALDSVGNAYAAVGGGNVIQKIDTCGETSIVAGNVNSTAIAEPSSARFGRTSRDKDVLYVTTGGAIGIPVQTPKGPVSIGAQLIAVQIA